MNTYKIIKKPENFDWSKVPVASISNHLEVPEVDISATAQVCYDDDALYVKLTAKEKNIRAEGNHLLDAPCQDSCLEFFFSPMADDIRYFNIEYNPNCCIYLGIGSNAKDLVRLIPEAGFPFGANAVRTSDGWEITYQIPFQFIRRFFPTFSPVSGMTIRGNFYKCGDYTEKEHYLSWNPITGDVISFHRPCDFGILEFD